MSDSENSVHTERLLTPANGFAVLAAALICFALMIPFFLIAINEPASVPLLIITCSYWGIIFPFLMLGLKIIHPNEAVVYVLFGKYYGTLAKEGFYWINPFCAAFVPTAYSPFQHEAQNDKASAIGLSLPKKTISLKTNTLNGEKQKMADSEGNLIEVGAVVIWRVTNSAKAILQVDSYGTYLSVQCDSTVRDIARLYPYEVPQNGGRKSLCRNPDEAAGAMKAKLQERMDIAGIEIIDMRISHLSRLPEACEAEPKQKRRNTAKKKQNADNSAGILKEAIRPTDKA